MQYALGLHHFNISYVAGNIKSYHRAVREALIPFIDLLYKNPHWAMNFEMNGYSIEFIARYYPDLLKRIKILIEKKQIEFISCTYSPQLWPAFPKKDLIKSINLNRMILKKYDLPVSRIFFTQENFIGEGVKKLNDWFDLVLIKDDYYYYFNDLPDKGNEVKPYYLLENMKVIIGWSHILDEFKSYIINKMNIKDIDDINSIYFSDINCKEIIFDKLSEQKFNTKLIDYQSSHKGITWKWYHYGSSERFGKVYMNSSDIIFYKFDPKWFFLSESILKEYEQKNFKFITVSGFLKEIDKTGFIAPKIDFLFDGSWNMIRTKGVYLWMGWNIRLHEDDLLVRTHNWLSRNRLLGIETLLKIKPYDELLNKKIKKMLMKAWKHQLLAEISDSTGWEPEYCEVIFGLNQSEKVLNIVAKIADYIKLKKEKNILLVDTENEKIKNEDVKGRIIKFKKYKENDILLYGSEGAINIEEIDLNEKKLIIDFFPNHNICGVEFNLKSDFIAFSPALIEDEVKTVKIDDIKPDVLYLPIPNGLIGLGEDYWLIRHNEYMNLAVCIDKIKKKIKFEIINPRRYPYRWVMSLYSGNKNEAVKKALKINYYPDLYI